MEKKKILWASRHQLDAEAEAELQKTYPGCQIVQEEILWPADRDEANEMALGYLNTFDILAGIWPAQAIEAFLDIHYLDGVITPSLKVWSPVSVPETEPDQKKVRPFRFYRWAVII